MAEKSKTQLVGSILEAALDYAKRGWYVFPVYEIDAEGNCACGNSDCRSPGKHPRTPNGFKDATVDSEQIRDWWRQWPSANVGIATGEKSEIMVLDIDGEKGLDSAEKLETKYGRLPLNALVRTGGGGGHIYFNYPGFKVKSRSQALGPEYPFIDVKGDFGCVVAPPSVHISGENYEWEKLKSLPSVPDWLINLMDAGAYPSSTGEADVILEGKRNTTLTSKAGQHHRQGVDKKTLKEKLLADNVKLCRPPLPDEEVISIVESVTKYPRPYDYAYTDLGNAELFVAQNGRKVRYCTPKKSWYVWTGKRWQPDEKDYVRELMKLTIRSIYAEAAKIEDKSDRGNMANWAKQSEAAYRMDAALKLAKSDEAVAILPKSFDADDWLLNCENGTINLKTGELNPHNPDDTISRICPVYYDREATFGMWDKFLSNALDENEEMLMWLAKAIGYSVTGDVSEEKMFFIHGNTATGKSTFTEAIKVVLGDYAQTADFETFLRRSQVGDTRNDVARLEGARFVVSNEVDEGKRLAEGLVKSLTGGDTITARFLYQEQFEFKCKAKLWLAANHAPQIKDNDDAIWRRILKVPFEHGIPESQRDPKIKSTLQNTKIAGPAILAWIVTGCLLWQKEGLGDTKEIRHATKELRQDNNPLKDFFAERCVFGENLYVTKKGMREEYEKYAKESGIKYPLGPKEFNIRLREKGCTEKTKKLKTKNVSCWIGVEMNSDSYDEID